MTLIPNIKENVITFTSSGYFGQHDYLLLSEYDMTLFFLDEQSYLCVSVCDTLYIYALIKTWMIFNFSIVSSAAANVLI